MNPATKEEIEALKAIYGEDLECQMFESGSAVILVALKGHEVGASWFSASIEFLLTPEYPNQPPANITLRHPRGLNEAEINSCLSSARKIFEQAIDDDESEYRHLLYDAIEAARDYLSKRSSLSLPCPICLYGFLPDDSVFVTTECSHHFHTYCLARYIDNTRRDQARERGLLGRTLTQQKPEVIYCPVCRTVIDGNRIGVDVEDGASDQEPKAWSAQDSQNNQCHFELSSLANPIERNFKELWERQKRNGGIIDLQREKDRFLVTEHTRIPPAATNPISSSYQNSHSMQQ